MTPLVETTNSESDIDRTANSFEALNLEPGLLRGIYAYGLGRPSAIQRGAIIKGK